MDDLYQQHILDHYELPRQQGRLSDATHQASATNVSCGDSMTVELRLDDKGVIADLRWTGEGCAISQASASILAERALGKKLSELQQLEFPQLLQLLQLDSLTPARVKCATLFLSALQRVQHV